VNVQAIQLMPQLRTHLEEIVNLTRPYCEPRSCWPCLFQPHHRINPIRQNPQLTFEVAYLAYPA
jgi:hypothetical protein